MFLKIVIIYVQKLDPCSKKVDGYFVNFEVIFSK